MTKTAIYFLIFFSVPFLFNCCQKRETINDGNVEKSTFEIDTCELHKQLLNIVKAYIHEHPWEEQYYIASDVDVYKNINDDYLHIYAIGISSRWDFSGEFSVSHPIFPFFYFRYKDKKVFMSSNMDYLLFDDKRTEKYRIKARSEKNYESWLFGVKKNGVFYIISKKAKDYMRPTETVTCKKKFQAPSIK